jgi:hypothetical protein
MKSFRRTFDVVDVIGELKLEIKSARKLNCVLQSFAANLMANLRALTEVHVKSYRKVPSVKRRARKNVKNFHFRRATKQSNLLAIVGVAFSLEKRSHKAPPLITFTIG